MLLVILHRDKTGTFIFPQGGQTWQWLRNLPKWRQGSRPFWVLRRETHPYEGGIWVTGIFCILKDIGLYFYGSTILTSTDVRGPHVSLGIERREKMETTALVVQSVLLGTTNLNCCLGLYKAPQFYLSVTFITASLFLSFKRYFSHEKEINFLCMPNKSWKTENYYL